MILTILAGLGRVLWPAIGTLVPGISPKLTAALLILLLAVVAIGAPAGAVWLHMRGEVKLARTARDSFWQSELSKAKDIHDQALAAARQAAQTVAATPDDRADRLLICQASPTCRDRRR